MKLAIMLLALALLAARNEYLNRRVTRRIEMAQADIDGLTTRVEALTEKVNNYWPPAGDGTEDYSKLDSAVGELETAVNSKLSGSSTTETPAPAPSGLGTSAGLTGA